MFLYEQFCNFVLMLFEKLSQFEQRLNLFLNRTGVLLCEGFVAGRDRGVDFVVGTEPNMRETFVRRRIDDFLVFLLGVCHSPLT